MEHKIINTGDYLLIVDDSEIKKETYCYDSINNILVFYKDSMKNIGFQKVISHLPLNNSPILEGVDLLPPLEDEIEKYKYTEEDMIEAIEFGRGQVLDNVLIGDIHQLTDIFINSVQQPKMPVGFKRSVEILNVLLNEKNISFPAKTTNSQGHTQWIGEYIY